MALFIVALVAAMAYVMMARLERDTHRTALLLHDTQADFYAQGSVAWAMDQLRNDWERQKTNKVVDPIPIKSPMNELQGYKISSTIEDMQARYNINNLTQMTSFKPFIRLLQTVQPSLSTEKAEDILRAVVDWIAPVTTQQPNTFSQYYLSLSSPYRAAHRPMVNRSELRLVKGMTPSLFRALMPYVTALPDSQPINVQTALPPVLMTLSQTLNLESAQRIEQSRQQTPFTSTKMFFNLDVVKNHRVSEGNVTVTSQYFLVKTNVEIEKQTIVLYTLLERITNGTKVTINTLWQSRQIW